MKNLNYVAAIVVAAWAASIASDAAAAASKKRAKSASAPTGYSSIRAQCHNEAGAYYVQGVGWYYQGGIGTAQRQRFYNCLDARMGHR